MSARPTTSQKAGYAPDQSLAELGLVGAKGSGVPAAHPHPKGS